MKESHSWMNVCCESTYSVPYYTPRFISQQIYSDDLLVDETRGVLCCAPCLHVIVSSLLSPHHPIPYLHVVEKSLSYFIHSAFITLSVVTCAAAMLLLNYCEAQARIGKGWPSRRKASKLEALPRAYTKVGCHPPTHHHKFNFT